MTNPTADALTAAAEALQAAATALRTAPPASPWRLGQDLTREDLDALPIGSRARDKDDDEWEKLPLVGWKFGSNAEGVLKLPDYFPARLTEIGTGDHDLEPEPASEPSSTTFTATLPEVDLTETPIPASESHWTYLQELTREDLGVLAVGSILIDKDEDTWTKTESGWAMDGLTQPWSYAPFRLIYAAPGSEPAEENRATSEPAVTFPFTQLDYYQDRKVEITETYDRQAKLQISPVGSYPSASAWAYLTPERARSIAAALTAFADPA